MLEDWVILSSTGERILVGLGTVSYKPSIEKAKNEYKKYQVKIISLVEQVYLETLKEISNKIDDKIKIE